MVLQAIRARRFNLGICLGVVAFHLAAATAAFTFSWPGVIAFAATTVLTLCLGVTLGFHRLLTHGSFQTPRPLKYLLAFLGCLALQGGPVRWVATHRIHHKAADTPNDPHSSKEGFLWSHLLWNFYDQPELESRESLKRFAPDIYNDAVLRFMDKHHIWLYAGFAGLSFLLGSVFGGWRTGLSLVVWGCVLRTVYVWHATWLVNSATHYWGYRNYDSPDQSRNTWWVALLTFGEGWHNNHHADQRCAKAGHRWFELDVTYWIIALLRRVGLASGVVGTRLRPAYLKSRVNG